MGQKYVLQEHYWTFFTKSGQQHNVRRVKAVKSFCLTNGTLIHPGDIGGYVESIANLSQDGNCWVTKDAMILDSAYVCDDALISGEAVVHGSSLVKGRAQVREYANVRDKATVSGYGVVGGHVIVQGTLVVHDLCETDAQLEQLRREQEK